MAAQGRGLAVEVLLLIGDRGDWTDEFDRRHTMYNLVLVSRQFNKVFTPVLYQEFEYTEEDWLYEQHLRALLSTIQRKSELASFIRKLRIVNWCPEVFFDPQNESELVSHTYDLVDQLVSLAWNVREIKIRLPNLPILYHKPFSELQRLHVLDFVPFVRGLTGRLSGRRTVYLPTISHGDRALNLSSLSTVLTSPKLSELKIEACHCIGGSFVHSDTSNASSVDTIQIHSGHMATAIVSKLLQSVASLKIFRYSVLESTSNTETTSVHWVNPGVTPSTQDMGKKLERHKQTLTALEITKCLGLSHREGEIIESFSDFEQLRSLCIDAAMLLGRWHCNHQARKIDDHPSTVLTWADIDKHSRRHPCGLADCLPSGLEDLVLSINDDMPDTFLLEIISSLVEQRSRLSALRRIGFYRHRISYCPECLRQHGKYPSTIRSADESVSLFNPIPLGERDRVMLVQIVRQLKGTGLEVYPAFEYDEWPSRRSLWDKAGPCLTTESGTSEIQTVQLHLSYPGLDA